MDNFKQRNEMKNFMAPVYQSNVCDHQLPTFEELAWTADEIDELNQYMTGVGESSHSQVLKQVGPRRSCKPGCTHCLINRLSNLHTNPRNQWWFDIAIKQPGGNIGSGRGISQPSLKIPEYPLSGLFEGTNLSELHRDNVLFSGSCQQHSSVIQSRKCLLDRACGKTSQYSPTELHPSTSSLGESLLLGTKDAPIVIPDSPDRENLSDQGHQESQRSNKGKRLREPEPEVQVQCSSPSNKTKRVKMLNGSQNKGTTQIPQSAPFKAPMHASPLGRTEIELPSVQIGSHGTQVLAIRVGSQYVGGGTVMGGSIDHLPIELGSVSQHDSAIIHRRTECGTTCNTRSDGVEYIDGCIVIPQGRDMVLEELLGESRVKETSGHMSKKLGSVSTVDSGETLLLGTKFAPIEIPYSPDRENLSDQGHQESKRSNKGNRLREPKPEVQVQCYSPSNKAKRVKMLHGSQNKGSTPIRPSATLNVLVYASPPERTEIELHSIQIGSDGTQVLARRDGAQHVGGGPLMGGSIDHLPSELESILQPDSAIIHQRTEGWLQSLETDVDGTTCNTRSDGVDYIDGCIVVPQGRDMVLEELLGEPWVKETSGHLCNQLESVSIVDSGDEYFSSLLASNCDHSTRCSRERGHSIF